MAVVGKGDLGFASETTTRKSAQQQMAGAMPHQGAHVMGDNECAPQKLVRLIGCRDSAVRPEIKGFALRAKQFGQTPR
jgi:hypothetical protein